MKKSFIFTLVAIAGLLIAGCAQTQPNQDISPLYNATINGELENLTLPSNMAGNEFMFNFTLRSEAEYEFAKDDVFLEAGQEFNASKVSVLGVMLGDYYEDVIARLGTPDMMFVASDRSYSNLEYGRKIGVPGNLTAVTYHVENGIVTRITMRKSFDKYLSGKTQMGTQREEIYSVFDVPDYMSFLEAHRVFHYVQNGLELYFRTDKLDIVSLVPPKEFKGVVYKNVRIEISPGVWANVTRPFEIE